MSVWRTAPTGTPHKHSICIHTCTRTYLSIDVQSHPPHTRAVLSSYQQLPMSPLAVCVSPVLGAGDDVMSPNGSMHITEATLNDAKATAQVQHTQDEMETIYIDWREIEIWLYTRLYLHIGTHVCMSPLGFNGRRMVCPRHLMRVSDALPPLVCVLCAM